VITRVDERIPLPFSTRSGALKSVLYSTFKVVATSAVYCLKKIPSFSRGGSIIDPPIILIIAFLDDYWRRESINYLHG
jgi:hypothetical protein